MTLPAAAPLRSISGTLPRSRLPPARLLVPALAVALLAALPVAYRGIRALEVEPAELELVLRPGTARVRLASGGLGAGVATGAIAIGLPVAWLPARTDLPGRRLWSVLTVVPLAIPSYVIAFAFLAALGPRG